MRVHRHTHTSRHTVHAVTLCTHWFGAQFLYPARLGRLSFGLAPLALGCALLGGGGGHSPGAGGVLL